MKNREFSSRRMINGEKTEAAEVSREALQKEVEEIIIGLLKENPPEYLVAASGLVFKEIKEKLGDAFDSSGALLVSRAFEHVIATYDFSSLPQRPSNDEEIASVAIWKDRTYQMEKKILASYGRTLLRDEPFVCYKDILPNLLQTKIGRDVLREKLDDYFGREITDRIVTADFLLDAFKIDPSLAERMVAQQIRFDQLPVVESVLVQDGEPKKSTKKRVKPEIYQALVNSNASRMMLEHIDYFPDYNHAGEGVASFLSSLDTVRDGEDTEEIESSMDRVIEKLFENPKKYHVTYDQLFLALLDTEKGGKIFASKIANDTHNYGKLSEAVAIKALQHGFSTQILYWGRKRFRGIAREDVDDEVVFTDEFWQHIDRHVPVDSKLTFIKSLPQYDGRDAQDFLTSLPAGIDRWDSSPGKAVMSIFENSGRCAGLQLDKSMALELCDKRYGRLIINNAEKFSGLDKDVAQRILSTSDSSEEAKDLLDRIYLFSGFTLDENVFNILVWRFPAIFYDREGAVLDRFTWIKERLGEQLYSSVKPELLKLVVTGKVPNLSVADWKYLFEDGGSVKAGLVKIREERIGGKKVQKKVLAVPIADIHVIAGAKKLKEISFAEPQGAKIFFDSLLGSVSESAFSSELGGELQAAVRESCDIFGYDRILRYGLREGGSWHDAYYSMRRVLKLFDTFSAALSQESGKNKPEAIANQFYGNILQQVSRDDAEYEAGSAHEHFNTIVAALDGVNIQEALDKAKKSKIPSLSRLATEFSSIKIVFSSWDNLQRFSILYDTLQRSEEVLPMLEQLFREAKESRDPDSAKKALAEWVEVLGFHRFSKVDLRSLIQFVTFPYDVFKVEDGHTAPGFHEAKNPSRYCEIEHLDLSAFDLRDALVGGALDRRSAFRSFSVTYKVDNRAFERVGSFGSLLKAALGSEARSIKGTARDPKKLFLSLKEALSGYPELDLGRLLSGDIADKDLPEPLVLELERLLWFSQEGLPSPSSAKRVFHMKMGAKRDPYISLAGNDTACCMKFGDGKFWDYIYGLNNGQLICQIESLNQGEKSRTVAQSLTTVNSASPDLAYLLALLRDNRKDIDYVYNQIPREVLEEAKEQVMAYDNIETNQNFLGKNSEDRARNEKIIEELYADFSFEYLQRYAQDENLRRKQVVIGKGYADALTNLPPRNNIFLPRNPLTYTDNKDKECFSLVPRTPRHYMEKMVIESPNAQKTEHVAMNNPGCAVLTYRDALKVIYLRNLDNTYHPHPETTKQSVEVENALIAQSINNEHKKRPDLSVKYRDKNNVMTGYMLAYEGRKNKNGREPMVLIFDSVSSSRSQKDGARESLIDGFLELYGKNYLEKRILMPIGIGRLNEEMKKMIGERLSTTAAAFGLRFERTEEQDGLLVLSPVPLSGSPEALSWSKRKESRDQINHAIFVYRPGKWAEIRNAILSIEKQAFGQKGFSKESLEADFENPETTVILLRGDDADSIIGYTYAIPQSADEAYVSSTAVLPDYQGKGLVSKMLDTLESELKKKGFTHVSRDATLEKGYAENLIRRYGDKVIEARIHDSPYGKQMYIKTVL